MIVILVVFSSHFDLPTYPLPPSSLPLSLPPPLPHLLISVPFRFGVLLISLPLRFHFGSISNLLPLHWNWLRFLRFAGFLSSQRMGIMIPGNLVVISRIPPPTKNLQRILKRIFQQKERRESVGGGGGGGGRGRENAGQRSSCNSHEISWKMAPHPPPTLLPPTPAATETHYPRASGQEI